MGEESVCGSGLTHGRCHFKVSVCEGILYRPGIENVTRG